MSNTCIDHSQAAEMFKALSNPHRLSIFKRLCANCAPNAVCKPDASNCCCVGEIGETLNIAPSTLSHHLKELNRAGLVVMQRCGKSVKCSVDPEVLNRLTQFFSLDVYQNQNNHALHSETDNE